MAYRYNRHSDLLHSLFVGIAFEVPWEFVEWRQPPMYFGFPEGWVEDWIDENEIVVKPEGDDVPMARLLHARQFGSETVSFDSFEEVMDVVREHYVLDEDAPVEMFTTCRDLSNPRQDVVEYSAEGRRGYIRIYGVYLLEASAPEEQFEDYQDNLLDITESMLVTSPCG